MIAIKYCCFWPGFNPTDFFINKFIDNYKIVTDDSYDVIIMSVFNYNNLKVKESSKKILFNGEHPSYIDRFIKITGIKLDLVIGFTQNASDNINNITQIYYPLWILYYDNVYSQEYFDKRNQELTKIDNLLNKKFCCLINSHDMNNTRTPIYNILNKIKKVDCPGKLLNNMKSIGSSSEDKIDFIKNYIFNICSENGIGSNYFTEKLPQCIDGNCIPIYCGDMGTFNEKIFNKNRIIFVSNKNDLLELENKIKDFMSNKQKLIDFYKQPIFNNNTYNNIVKIKEIAKLIINKIIK